MRVTYLAMTSGLYTAVACQQAVKQQLGCLLLDTTNISLHALLHC